MQLSLHFIPAPEDMAQKALHAIFDVVPRIAFRLNRRIYYWSTY